jgi:subtilisin
MSIDDQVATIGHARVIAVLKTAAQLGDHGDRGAALEEVKALQKPSARLVQKHFKSFRGSAQTLLAKQMALNDPGSPHTYAADADARIVRRAGVHYYPNLGILYGAADQDGLAALAQDENVGEIIAAPAFTLIAPEESAALEGAPVGRSWAIGRMKIDALWDQGLFGDGVLIGHLDTGVDASHPALAGKIDAFAYFDDLGRNVLTPPPAQRDTGRHGTHTAGILVGDTFEGHTFGVAPKARLVSATVIEGGDTPARVLGALDWCVAQGVRIVNVSLGLTGHEPQFDTILEILRARGVLPVIAIGNEGPDTSRTPGNLPAALSVGALSPDDTIWRRSSSQRFTAPPPRTSPVLIAPGGEIWSSVPGNRMTALSGTSMAAPHISGLAALLMQHRPAAAIHDIEAAILNSCTRPAQISSVRGNLGVPDAARALASL